MANQTADINLLSNKLNDISLKQERLLGEGTHHYERYSLPASRVPSNDSPQSVANSGAASGSSSPIGVKPLAEYPAASGAGASPSNAIPIVNSSASARTRPSAVFLQAVDTGSTAYASGSESSSPVGSHSSPATNDTRDSYFERASRKDIANNNAAATFVVGSPHSHTSSSPSISRDSSPVQITHNDPSTISTSSSFPRAEPDDPYARKHRVPQIHNLAEIAPRFVFSKTKRSTSSHATSSLKSLSSKSEKSTSSLLSPSGHTASASILAAAFGSSGNKSDSEDSSSSKLHKSRGSMVELKRFFKPVRKHHHHTKEKARASSPAPKSSSTIQHTTSQISMKNMPFGEEGTSNKYGKIGRVLGSGAGGSVRLMKRTSDGTTFAVKEFRARHANESEREYSKKVTAEFCIGSTLHHPNIIETLDIIQDGERYFEVMEYCPFDFFAIVMSGKMSKKEVGCDFKQILNGVRYLHDMGLAHRDLKLDNCVVTENGIIKIIDFGSACVFRYPFEEDVVLAHGVVGSDPYLAPEVLGYTQYDPQPADIWSIAVIFCCMSLRRFPWKVPRMSDSSFKMFASEPNADENHPPPMDPDNPDHHVAIKGPWRLLRLLPTSSRHIIGRMLEIDFTKRATLDEIWADPWVQSLQMCTVNEGALVKSTDHEHTFVPVEEAHLDSYKKT